MKKIILIIALISLNLMASKNVWISMGEAYGIEPRLLYAISKVESNITPLVVSVNHTKITQAQLDTLTKALSRSNIAYKKLNIVLQIYSKNMQEAKAVIEYLDKNNYASFDIGLMQINNIHKEMLAKKNIPLSALLDEKINISIGAQILWDCYKKYGSKEKALNAYNGKLVNNDYYQKVLSELDKLLLPHENNNKNLFYRIL